MKNRTTPYHRRRKRVPFVLPTVRVLGFPCPPFLLLWLTAGALTLTLVLQFHFSEIILSTEVDANVQVYARDPFEMAISRRLIKQDHHDEATQHEESGHSPSKSNKNTHQQILPRYQQENASTSTFNKMTNEFKSLRIPNQESQIASDEAYGKRDTNQHDMPTKSPTSRMKISPSLNSTAWNASSESETRIKRPVRVCRDQTRNNTTVTETCQKAWLDYHFPVHGCRVNPQSHRPHCQFLNIRLDTSKVLAPKMGGENLMTVLGQPESNEQIEFLPGAWSVSEPFEQPRPYKEFHYIHKVLKHMNRSMDHLLCDHVWNGTTLFIQRYEYANLYHTMSDWWNTFFSLPRRNQDDPLHLVFLDAHPASNLDQAWQTFVRVQELHWVRRLLPGSHCFERARFVPAGYTSPLYSPKENETHCPNEQMSKPFVEAFLRAHNVSSDTGPTRGHVVVLDRVPYLAHARSNVNAKPARALGNLESLALETPHLLPGSKWTIEVTTLVHQTMAEQLATIRRAHFLIGNHGAGLTHLLFASPGAHVMELSCPDFIFTDVAAWRPSIHHYCLCFPPPNSRAAISNGNLRPNVWRNNILPVLEAVIQNETVALQDMTLKSFPGI